MDTIEKQIDEFRYEAADGAKVRIVEDMAVNDDERVVPFLLEVLADPGEFELARVEAAKLLMSGLEAHRPAICEALAEVLRRSQESEAVRCHALEAAEAYGEESAELRAAIEQARRDGPRAEEAARAEASDDAEMAMGFLEELGGLDV